MPPELNWFGSPDAPLSIPSLVANLVVGLLLAIVLRWHFSRFGRALSNPGRVRTCLEVAGTSNLGALVNDLRQIFPTVGVTFLDQNRLPSV